MLPTETIAKLIIETDDDRSPSEAIANAKIAIQDCLGTITDSKVTPPEAQELLRKVNMFVDTRIQWQKGSRPVIVDSLDLIDRLEELDRISTLTDLLVGKPR